MPTEHIDCAQHSHWTQGTSPKLHCNPTGGGDGAGGDRAPSPVVRLEMPPDASPGPDPGPGADADDAALHRASLSAGEAGTDA